MPQTRLLRKPSNFEKYPNTCGKILVPTNTRNLNFDVWKRFYRKCPQTLVSPFAKVIVDEIRPTLDPNSCPFYNESLGGTELSMILIIMLNMSNCTYFNFSIRSLTPHAVRDRCYKKYLSNIPWLWKNKLLARIKFVQLLFNMRYQKSSKMYGRQSCSYKRSTKTIRYKGWLNSINFSTECSHWLTVINVSVAGLRYRQLLCSVWWS